MMTKTGGLPALARTAVLTTVLGVFAHVTPGSATEEIVIGVIQPLSGPNAQFGVGCQRGIELAAESIRATGPR